MASPCTPNEPPRLNLCTWVQLRPPSLPRGTKASPRCLAKETDGGLLSFACRNEAVARRTNLDRRTVKSYLLKKSSG